MQHERYVGFEIKALSNLLRRRLWSAVDRPRCRTRAWARITPSPWFLRKCSVPVWVT